MLGQMMHPVYSISNVIYLGRSSKEELAGFSLGSLALNLIFFSSTLCFTYATATLVS